MTGSELTRHLIDVCAFQVEKVFEGITEDNADLRVNEHCMSPRQTLVHLGECMEALLASMRGEQHSWGTFKPEDTSVEGLLKGFREARSIVREKVAAAGDDSETLKHTGDFIVLHDPYHVGQMASFRLTHTPGWDFYSIYPS